jgi:Protein of unknown function (DUF2628)
VRFWTVHVRAGEEPVLVREGFSWGALIFGWLWLLAHRAWIPALLLLAAGVAVTALTTGGIRALLLAAIALLQGLFGNDFRRWSLERRRYRFAHVIAARDADGALDRLLQRRPELAEDFVR